MVYPDEVKGLPEKLCEKLYREQHSLYKQLHGAQTHLGHDGKNGHLESSLKTSSSNHHLATALNSCGESVRPSCSFGITESHAVFVDHIIYGIQNVHSGFVY